MNEAVLRRAGRNAPSHLFAVGQTVRFKSQYGMAPTAADIFRVMATLPPKGTSPQYRIRNDDERHERVTTQDSIEIVEPTGSDATLIERTFRSGQGSETQ